MKTAFACLIALANIIATSASDKLASQSLTCTVERYAAKQNKTITKEGQRCEPDRNMENRTEVWNKTGGFYYNNNGVNLFYTIEGTGDPIVLIHGWACDHSDWIFQIPFLLEYGFQVITIDQRGHGRSSTPVPAIDSQESPYSYDPETLADDAAALLEYLHVGNSSKRGAAIIMGHSLGGVVASELAFRHSKLVRALVLVDSAYYTPISQGELIVATLKNSSASTAPEVAASLFEAMESSVAERPAWIRAWRLRKTWGMPGYVVTAVFEQLIQFLGQWSTCIEYRVERKGVPKLVTVAEQSYADFENEVGLAEGDRVEVLDGGHWHFQINSTRFNAIIEEWFMARGYIGR
ncbi:uncharacterized protein ALTATR162_LOCUS11691 [Alternaria atra]|uniref:AB hydrolase-1 domain-containing protein n=1 Tax=Alternaria atra TaxID=119953 RepID=A0A8J2NBQ0_9PLEO|nr:uncharacterized protein ALTATR162_LOCUS11691 [Alternaria atra]CAG5186745.1 unnamed protein product [Alternaria atra]